MKEYSPPQSRGNFQIFSTCGGVSQEQKARKDPAWVAMQGMQLQTGFMSFSQKFMFFQSRFSAFSLISLGKKILYTYIELELLTQPKDILHF